MEYVKQMSTMIATGEEELETEEEFEARMVKLEEEANA